MPTATRPVILNGLQIQTILRAELPGVTLTFDMGRSGTKVALTVTATRGGKESVTELATGQTERDVLALAGQIRKALK